MRLLCVLLLLLHICGMKCPGCDREFLHPSGFGAHLRHNEACKNLADSAEGGESNLAARAGNKRRRGGGSEAGGGGEADGGEGGAAAAGAAATMEEIDSDGAGGYGPEWGGSYGSGGDSDESRDADLDGWGAEGGGGGAEGGGGGAKEGGGGAEGGDGGGPLSSQRSCTRAA